AEHLLARPDHHRDHQDRQRERPGEPGERHAEGEDPERQDEQPGDHRGDPGHDVDEEPDDPGEPPARAVLDQVDRGEQADRHRDERGEQHLLEGADDGVVGAAPGVPRPDAAHGVGEELQVEAGQAVPHHHPQHGEQRDDGEHEREADEGLHEPVLGPPYGRHGPEAGGHRRAHATALAYAARRATISRAAMFTASVIRKRTRPEAMSAPRPRSVASPKPFAMFAAMLFPVGPRIWKETVKVAGKIRATAMVSPMARPSPSMAALITPGRPNGS